MASSFIPLTDAQQKQSIDAEQAFAAWQAAWLRARDYVGGMHFKRVGTREYLYKTHDRRGNAKSMGARDEKTEEILQQFQSRKLQSDTQLKALAATLKTHAKINAALRVGAAPPIVADICTKLLAAGVMGKNLMVIGTNSLWAYAAMAGGYFSQAVTATTDIDLLWTHKAKLSLSVIEEQDAHLAPAQGLIDVLKKADRSFERLANQPFRASNDSGYLVDLIRQMPRPPWKNEPTQFQTNSDDLIATDIWNMKWLLNAPRHTQSVIAANGTVFTMTVPDPRAFCAFKCWLATSEERDPRKKSRDMAQALAVYQLIHERLPHLSHWEEISSVPKNVIKKMHKTLGS